jgi:integrase
MEYMLAELGSRGDRAWDLLEKVRLGRLSLGTLYDAWNLRDLQGLRLRLDDTDLRDFIEGWQASLRNSLNESETAEHYLSHVRTLISCDEPFPRSSFTVQRLTAWMSGLAAQARENGRQKLSSGTRRKYHASMSSFALYLKKMGHIQFNPMAEVDRPSAGQPRRRYLEMADLAKLIEAQPAPFNVLSALMHATGMEISAALRTTRRDVDIVRKKVHAKGTKTGYRDRYVNVAEWAWPLVEGHIRTLLPDAPLFPGVTRWYAGGVHREACEEVGISDYRMHDARHTFAVRAIRAGAPFEFVAAQLGHGSTQMVISVYGRFKPSESEMTDWERIARVQDESMASESAVTG